MKIDERNAVKIAVALDLCLREIAKESGQSKAAVAHRIMDQVNAIFDGLLVGGED